EELLAIVHRAFGIEPEQDREVACDRLVGNALAQLRPADLGRVALEDPAEDLHMRREGEVGTALAVRQRAPVNGAPPPLLYRCRELLGQASLADAGRAEDGDEVRDRLPGHALPDPAQNLELARPSDEVAGEAPLASPMERPQRDPRLHRLGFPLGDDRG